RGVADHMGHLRKRGDRRLHHIGCRDRRMRGHGTDDQGAPALLDAREVLDRAEIDEGRRARQTLLHRRQERVATGKNLAVLMLRQRRGCASHAVRANIFECIHRSVLLKAHSAASLCGARWQAFQTVSAVAGIATCSWPTASVRAWMTAAGAAIAPASPQPFTPKGFDGQGVTVMPTWKEGRSSARGMA